MLEVKNVDRTERGSMPTGKRPVHHPHLLDQILLSPRAVAMKKGVESAQVSRKPVPGIDLLNLTPCKQTKVAATHKGEVRA